MDRCRDEEARKAKKRRSIMTLSAKHTAFLLVLSWCHSTIPTVTSFAPTFPTPAISYSTNSGTNGRRTATIPPINKPAHPSSPSPSSLSMISSFLGGGDDKSTTAALPKDVKEAVSKCRAAVQTALEKRTSRMEINFPVGTKFGVEAASNKKKKKKQQQSVDEDVGMPTTDDFDNSDRELARLFVEMFQAVGGDAITVVYRDANLADTSKKRWKNEVGAECTITSVERKKSKKAAGAGKKKKKAVGFAAKMNAEFDDSAATSTSGPFRLAENCEVALFVAPGPRELIAVERVCEEVGMGTLVVLLNARLGDYDSAPTDAGENVGDQDDEDDFFQEEFNSIFHLSAAQQADAPGCLLYHSFPSGWILARKPKVGPPKTIATFEDRPTNQQCRDAYKGVEIGDLEQGVENALENVAGWFK